MEIYKRKFSEMFLRGLEKAGLSQAEFASKINVNTSTVSNWATGKSLPGEKNLDDILRVLGVTEAYFLGDLTTDVQRYGPALTMELSVQILNHFQKRSQTMQKVLLALLCDDEKCLDGLSDELVQCVRLLRSTP